MLFLVSNGPPVNFEIVERSVTPTVCIKTLWEKKALKGPLSVFFYSWVRIENILLWIMIGRSETDQANS